MNKAICFVLALASWAAAEMKPLPSAGEAWFGDPVAWAFRPEAVRCRLGRHSLALYEGAPRSAQASVEATFTPRKAGGKDWDIAGVVLIDDERNFWHLALVQAPPEHGSAHSMELAEMRDGRWLAHLNLKIETEQYADAKWEFGKGCRLRLSLDAQGVEGTVSDADGRRLMHKRLAFSADAVRQGRPGLRAAGMTGEFTDLRADWGQAIAEPAPPEAACPPYASDSFVEGISDKATGFFRVVRKPDGRWWTIDPLGRGMVLLGVDHVTFGGHWCEKLGYAPHKRKNEKRFKDHAEWEAWALERLKAWGFNMLGAGCDRRLNHRGLVHTVFLNMGSHFGTRGEEFYIAPYEHRPCSVFPNVFHPDFEAFCRYRARQACRPHRSDPWMLGYFIDNELAWWGRGPSDTGLADAVMKMGATHTAKLALRDFLADRAGKSIERFNALWGTKLKGFDDLLALTALPSADDAQREAKREFLRLAAERYFTATSRAIRREDPNHMVLGARFAGTGGAHPVVWEVAGQHCEIVTFNCYPFADLDEGRVYTSPGKKRELAGEHFETYYNYVKRPMLVTEWSFPALDAGVPSVHGAGQRFRTQRERTEATSLFARSMLSLPFLLGYDYFMWVDEPALGISTPFPEDSNYGLINEDGQPYALLTEMFTALHARAGKLRFEPPPQARPLPPARPIPTALAVAAKAAGGAGGAKAFFVREGDAFRAGNGCLELQGRLGEGYMVRGISLTGQDKPLGQYDAMLHVLDQGGQNRWMGGQTVKAVDGKLVDGLAVVEITSTASAGSMAFELTHRLILPPGRPWFLAQAVSVKNTGKQPVRLRGLFFRLYSPIQDTPRTPPNVWNMPPADCWLDKDDGRFIGAIAPRGSDLAIHFWIDNTYKSVHPDAHLELEHTLAPGATWTPSEAAYIFCTAGMGGTAAWMDRIDTVSKLAEP